MNNVILVFSLVNLIFRFIGKMLRLCWLFYYKGSAFCQLWFHFVFPCFFIMKHHVKNLFFLFRLTQQMYSYTLFFIAATLNWLLQCLTVVNFFPVPYASMACVIAFIWDKNKNENLWQIMTKKEIFFFLFGIQSKKY